jgi:hypothetical protein
MWALGELAAIATTVVLPGNHDSPAEARLETAEGTAAQRRRAAEESRSRLDHAREDLIQIAQGDVWSLGEARTCSLRELGKSHEEGTRRVSNAKQRHTAAEKRRCRPGWTDGPRPSGTRRR